MLKNRSMPRSTVIPELPYPNIAEAIDWLSDAFGYTLRLRIGDHRAQLNVGDGPVVLTQQQSKTGLAAGFTIRSAVKDTFFWGSGGKSLLAHLQPSARSSEAVLAT